MPNPAKVSMAAEESGKGPSDVWTVGRIIRWCEEYFRGKGSASPRLDAELLAAHALGTTRVRLYVDWGKMLDASELAALRELVRRRAAAEPVAYILGVREFWSMTFRVNRDVLVPRPETEHTVEAVLNLVVEDGMASPRIADIGTGSGNIACALAKSLPMATILATDVSRAALAIAEENARRLGFADRIVFREGDMIDAARGCGPFDAVVSNPPYVADDQMAALSEEVRGWEPREALRGDGPDGLGHVRRLLRDAPAVLARPGAVVCEIGASQGAAALRIAEEAGFTGVAVRNDLSGRARVLIGRWACASGDGREEKREEKVKNAAGEVSDPRGDAAGGDGAGQRGQERGLADPVRLAPDAGYIGHP